MANDITSAERPPTLRERYSKVRPHVKGLLNRSGGPKPGGTRKVALVASEEEVKAKEQAQQELMIEKARSEEAQRQNEEKQKELQKAREEGRTDYKTGLLNERGYDERLRSEIERAIRSGTRLGLIAIDLDNLKRINDVYGGHHAGDKVITSIGTVINDHKPGKESATRTIDIGAHPHGDEFNIVCPDIKDGLALVAGRVRLAIEKIKIPGIEITTTASIGAAYFNPREEDRDKRHAYEEIEVIMKELQHKADIALYHAKDGGKNKLIIYEEGMTMPEVKKNE